MLLGAITALVTPMYKNGEIDFESLTKLVEFQNKNYISALVVVGSTGEGVVLCDEEKIAVIRKVIEVNAKKTKIIVGMSYAGTDIACEFIAKLHDIEGIDYILVTSPYYVKPTQDGIYQHFVQIAKISQLPIIIYNVPSRTNSDVFPDTVIKLAQNFPNIVGLKDATGNIARVCYLVKHVSDEFMLYSGDDSTAMAFMLCGGHGIISVVSNIIPSHVQLLCDYALAGNKTEAIMVNNVIMELCTLMGVEANPIPVKWGLFKRQIIASAQLRLPLTVLSECYYDKFIAILDSIDSK